MGEKTIYDLPKMQAEAILKRFNEWAEEHKVDFRALPKRDRDYAFGLTTGIIQAQRELAELVRATLPPKKGGVR